MLPGIQFGPIHPFLSNVDRALAWNELRRWCIQHSCYKIALDNTLWVLPTKLHNSNWFVQVPGVPGK